MNLDLKEKIGRRIMMGNKRIALRLKGDFYTMKTNCLTLKEVFATYPMIRRSDIAEWWYEYRN